jgi:hypothetical protein
LDVSYSIHWVQCVVLWHKQVFFSELHVRTRDGQTAKYGIFDARLIPQFRESLRSVYPDLPVLDHPKRVAAAFYEGDAVKLSSSDNAGGD